MVTETEAVTEVKKAGQRKWHPGQVLKAGKEFPKKQGRVLEVLQGRYKAQE